MYSITNEGRFYTPYYILLDVFVFEQYSKEHIWLFNLDVECNENYCLGGYQAPLQ